MAIIFLSLSQSNAQPLLESGSKGSSLLALEDGGKIKTVFGDDKVGFCFGYNQINTKFIDRQREQFKDRNVKNVPNFGIEVFGNSSGEIAKISEGNQFQKESGVSIYAGWKYLNSSLLSSDDLDQIEIAKMEEVIVRKLNGINECDCDIASLTQQYLVENEDGIRSEIRKRINGLKEKKGKLNSELLGAERFISNANLSKRYQPTIETSGIQFDSLMFSLEYKNSQFALFESKNDFANQFQKRRFDSRTVGVSYNAFFGGKSARLFGASFSIGNENNLADLKEVEVRDIQDIPGDALTKRTISTSRKGYSGAYDEYTEKTLKVDYAVYLDSIIEKDKGTRGRNHFGIDLFTRSSFEKSRETLPGISFFITERGAPLKILGGLSLVRDSEKKINTSLFYGFNY